MSDNELTALVNRMRQLESRLARTRAGALLLMLTLALAFVFGFASEPSSKRDGLVRATRFVLVDETGKERAVIGFDANRVGLFVEGDMAEKDSKDVRSTHRELLFVGVDTIEEMGRRCARIELRNEITPEVGSTLTANSIGLYDDKQDMGISLMYVKAPALHFIDRSGYPFVNLSYDEKQGTKFLISAPLGIKDAYDEDIEQFFKGEKPDSKVGEAMARSLRFRIEARPFAKPTLSLWHDGAATWSTP